MSDRNDARPTPASGMTAAVSATSAAKPSAGGEEIMAPKSDSANAILVALDGLRLEVRETRKESRERGEETSARFDKLDRKVDKLSLEDESLKLELRRLEQRQAGTDEDVRIMREDLRKDREARTREKEADTATFDAMRRFVEDSTRKNTQITAEAAARFEAGATKFDSAADDLASVKRHDVRQDERIAGLESMRDDVASLKKSDEARTKQVASIASGVAKLVRWQDAWWVKVLIGVAVFAGAFYGGMRAGTPSAKHEPAVSAPAHLPAATP